RGASPRRAPRASPRPPAVPDPGVHRLRGRAGTCGTAAERTARRSRRARSPRHRPRRDHASRDPVNVSPPWPSVTWTTPVLRRLDDTARAAVVRAGRAGADAPSMVYRGGDTRVPFFVVTKGPLEIHSIRRGDHP